MVGSLRCRSCLVVQCFYQSFARSSLLLGAVLLFAAPSPSLLLRGRALHLVSHKASSSVARLIVNSWSLALSPVITIAAI